MGGGGGGKWVSEVGRWVGRLLCPIAPLPTLRLSMGMHHPWKQTHAQVVDAKGRIGESYSVVARL